MDKKEMINKIQEMLLQEAEKLRKNKEIPTKEKIDKVDVLLDTYKFLDNYDENIKILKKHLLEKER